MPTDAIRSVPTAKLRLLKTRRLTIGSFALSSHTTKAIIAAIARMVTRSIQLDANQSSS